MGRIDNAVKALRGTRLVQRKDFLQPLPPMGGFGSSNILNRYGNKASQLEANVGAVWQANEIICIAAANIDIKLRKRKSDGTYEEVKDHKLLQLVKQPNAFMTGTQLRKLHYTYMNMVGEAYELKMGGDNKKTLPDALHVLPAHTTDFIIGKTWDDSVVRNGTKDYSIFDILRDYNPDPKSPYRGRGVIAAAAATIDTDQQAKEYNRRFFSNSARPSIVVETPGEMADDAYERFKQSFNEAFTGTENAHKPIIVEGATIKPFMLTQKEMDFLASQQFTRKEILAFFFVSGAMLGDVENANRSNMEASEYNLAKYAVKPRVEQYLELLNTRLVQLADTELEYYTDPIVPEDVEIKLKAATAAVNSWATIDEVRAGYNLPALPNKQGEQFYIDNRLVPISMAGTTRPAIGAPGDSTDEPLEGDKAQKKKPLKYPPQQ